MSVTGRVKSPGGGGAERRRDCVREAGLADLCGFEAAEAVADFAGLADFAAFSDWLVFARRTGAAAAWRVPE